jgi:hypothetical protein
MERSLEKSQLVWFRLRISFDSVEVMDSYSSDWGASTGDIIANASGTFLCVRSCYGVNNASSQIFLSYKPVCKIQA